MLRKQYELVFVTIIAGLIGGVASNWIFRADPIFAQKVPQNRKAIRAEQFILVDEQGNDRAVLLTVDGHAFLSIADKNKQPRITLGVAADGSPSLNLLGKDKKPRVILDVTPDNATTRLNLYDKGGSAAFVLSIEANGESGLALMDKNKAILWSAP